MMNSYRMCSACRIQFATLPFGRPGTKYGVEQEAYICVRGLLNDLAAHVLGQKLFGALQMDDLHKEIELQVTFPHLTEQHEGCFHLTSVGAGLEQGSNIGGKPSPHFTDTKFEY